MVCFAWWLALLLHWRRPPAWRRMALLIKFEFVGARFFLTLLNLNMWIDFHSSLYFVCSWALISFWAIYFLFAPWINMAPPSQKLCKMGLIPHGPCTLFSICTPALILVFSLDFIFLFHQFVYHILMHDEWSFVLHKCLQICMIECLDFRN